MRRIFRNIRQTTVCIAAVLASVTMTACKSFYKLGSNPGMTAQGAAYELIVVSNTPTWEGPAGETLLSILQQPIPALNQTEPMWNVMRVTPDAFKNIIAKHRNVIKLLVEDGLEPAIGVQYDVAAHPQTVMLIQAPSQQALADYIAESQDNIL